MPKRKTKHSRKTIKKRAGKKILVSEKSMTEDVLVKKMAENKLEKTEMVDKSEKEDESSTKTAEAKPDQTVKVEPEPVVKKIVQERNIQEESAEEKRKKVNAILKFEKELA